MHQTTITHLPSIGSDHCLLLMEMKERLDQRVKYFKFLHCWTENDKFMDIVQSCCQEVMISDPMWQLHQRMKKLASTLSIWSKKEFGNIFSTVEDFEEKFKNAEEQVIQHNSEENRAKLHLINASISSISSWKLPSLNNKLNSSGSKNGILIPNNFILLWEVGEGNYSCIKFELMMMFGYMEMTILPKKLVIISRIFSQVKKLGSMKRFLTASQNGHWGT